MLKHVLKFSDLGTHFKQAGFLRFFNLHTSYLAPQELGINDPNPQNDPQPWNDPQIDPEMIPISLHVDPEMNSN